jgi:hypothetical protein
VVPEQRTRTSDDGRDPPDRVRPREERQSWRIRRSTS